ncbi:hypothetical protein [Kerstersia sp.]|uniref:hypothetical protein n=1 Tax=Kerstersia sp. TaxID=1930783 RepID=UPI003F90EB64
MFSSRTLHSLTDLERELQKEHKHWLVLGASHEATIEFHQIQTCRKGMNFGIGVAIAISGARPKCITSTNQKNILIGFDSFISKVPLRPSPNSLPQYEIKKIDGVFFDFIPIKDQICVIHEIGAYLMTEDL